MSTRRPAGIALVSMLLMMSVVALLTCATLWVCTRLEQGSTLAVRDGRLDSAASYALAPAVTEWRSRGFAAMQEGTSVEIPVPLEGAGAVTASLAVSRLPHGIYWVVAEAAAGGARRRQNLLLRLIDPPRDTLAGIVASGSVVLSGQAAFVRDTTAGCAAATADILIPSTATVSASDGSLPTLTVQRSSTGGSSTTQSTVSGVDLSGPTVVADVVLPGGQTISAPRGVTHALGDLTVASGVGSGILIVDGLLVINGPARFSGVVVASGGLRIEAAGAEILGALRLGVSNASAEALRIDRQFRFVASPCIAQETVKSALMPRPVAGRRWAELM